MVEGMLNEAWEQPALDLTDVVPVELALSVEQAKALQAMMGSMDEGTVVKMVSGSKREAAKEAVAALYRAVTLGLGARRLADLLEHGKEVTDDK